MLRQVAWTDHNSCQSSLDSCHLLAEVSRKRSPVRRLASWRRSRRRKQTSPLCAPSSPTYFSRPRPWRFQRLSVGCSTVGSNSLRGALPRRSSRSTMNLSRPLQTVLSLSLPLAGAVKGPFGFALPSYPHECSECFVQALFCTSFLKATEPSILRDVATELQSHDVNVALLEAEHSAASFALVT